MSTKFILFPFLLLLSSDLLSKYFAHFYLREKISLIGNILSLELHKNPGIAFSFPLSGIALKIITITLIFGIIYYYLKEERQKKSLLVDTAFVLILAGAIGNGIERVWFSEVTDFIAVQNFSVFNFADAFITIGGTLFIWSLMRKK